MAKSLKHYREQTEKALVDLAWAQWNRLGLYGAGKASRASTDIEASIALVCLVGWLNGRLFDGALSWIHKYQDIISGERLKLFIKDIDDPFLPRCIGAMIESAAASKDAARWKYFLQTIKESLTQRKNEKGTIFWYSRGREPWTKRDATFKKWRLAKEETVFSSKLKRHDEILRTNQQIKYRYMFGNTARADVIYLLAVAGSTGLMTADLSSLTGYNHSSVFRILKDLSQSGIVQSLGAEGSKRASWCIRPADAVIVGSTHDSALINWKNAVPMCYALLKEMHRIESIKNELVAKHACFSLCENALKVFRASGFAHLPHVPAEPLENIALTDLLEILPACIKTMESMTSDGGNDESHITT